MGLRAGQFLVLALGIIGFALIPGSSTPGLSSPGDPETIPLTVIDYSGVARTNEPVTTGIPIVTGSFVQIGRAHV